jgi:hypothetical protein
MSFQISGLDVKQFTHLFGQGAEELAAQGVQRKVVDSNPGVPCRVSLQDVEVGENVLLMNFEHQAMPTPFRASHAIFVQEWASTAIVEKNEVPDMFRSRLLSVRAFDLSGMMIDADVIEGAHLESLIERLLANESVEYLHLHNARLGCYAGLVQRSG